MQQKWYHSLALLVEVPTQMEKAVPMNWFWTLTHTRTTQRCHIIMHKCLKTKPIPGCLAATLIPWATEHTGSLRNMRTQFPGGAGTVLRQHPCACTDKGARAGAEGHGLPSTLRPHQDTSTHRAGSASSSELNCLVNNHVFRAIEIGPHENIRYHERVKQIWKKNGVFVFSSYLLMFLALILFYHKISKKHKIYFVKLYFRY